MDNWILTYKQSNGLPSYETFANKKDAEEFIKRKSIAKKNQPHLFDIRDDKLEKTAKNYSEIKKDEIWINMNEGFDVKILYTNYKDEITYVKVNNYEEPIDEPEKSSFLIFTSQFIKNE